MTLVTRTHDWERSKDKARAKMMPNMFKCKTCGVQTNRPDMQGKCAK
jgi:hypothetical protein